MSMNCKEFLERLSEYFDEKTVAEFRSEFEGHAAKCGHCKVTFNTTRQTIEIYRNNELYELPQTLRERLREVVMKKCSKMAQERATHCCSDSAENPASENPNSEKPPSR